MTTTTPRPAPRLPEPPSPAASQSLPALTEPDRWRFGGSAIIVIGLLLVGFAAQFVGVSQIEHSRDQQLAFDDFRYQLANATAPVGQTGTDGRLLPVGTSVAVLTIPAIGVHEVVFEGTSSDVTRQGPGHRRDTPMPGQAGASVLYGRQAAYGAPFGSIGALTPGDVVTTTTGLGTARYVVSDVRFTGDPVPDAIPAGGGRLTLVSASGIPFLPSTVVRVDAKLETAPLATPQRALGYAALGDEELTMAGNGSVWPFLVIGLIGLFALIALFAVSLRFWGRRQTLVVAVPVVLVVGLFAAEQFTLLLPNLM